MKENRCPHCNVLIKNSEKTCEECVYLDNIDLARANAKKWKDHINGIKNATRASLLQEPVSKQGKLF